MTAIFSDNTFLPTIGNTRVHLGILIALVIAVILWILIRYTKWGYEVRVIGESTEAARYSGMNTVRNIILVMLISGGIAGIAGMVEVPGSPTACSRGCPRLWVYRNNSSLAGEAEPIFYHNSVLPIWRTLGGRVQRSDLWDTFFGGTDAAGPDPVLPAGWRGFYHSSAILEIQEIAKDYPGLERCGHKL
jgi:hypothetical protein